MDYLPEPAPTGAPGQLVAVENYLLNHFDRFSLRQRLTAALLKLMCYRRVAVSWNGWTDSPQPKLVASAVKELMQNHSGTLYMLLPEDDALLVLDWDSLYISVYNAQKQLRRLLKSIAQSENLAWRRSKPG